MVGVAKDFAPSCVVHDDDDDDVCQGRSAVDRVGIAMRLPPRIIDKGDADF